MTIKFEYGAKAQDLGSAVGQPLSAVDTTMRSFLGVDSGAVTLINGEDASAGAVLNDGDVVSYYKKTGEKGL